MNMNVDPMEFSDRLDSFYEIIVGQLRQLEEHRKKIEERRVELTVTPEEVPTRQASQLLRWRLDERGPMGAVLEQRHTARAPLPESPSG